MKITAFWYRDIVLSGRKATNVSENYIAPFIRVMTFKISQYGNNNNNNNNDYYYLSP
jgi:hypothetical protein